MSLDSNSNMGQAADRPSKKSIGDTEDKWDTKSVTKTYYRMTVREAQKYVEGLRRNDSKVPLDKLKDDEHRIMKNRARLSKTMSTKKLQGELEHSFKEWCDEVNAKIKGKNIGPFLAGRESLVKPKICTELGDQACEVRENEDPAREVNAYFMFFEKGDQEYKGKKYQGQGFPDYESFPDQRITVHEALYSDTHNPFLPILDDNGKPYLRYIHLPANHMGWIEQAMARYHNEHEKDPDKRTKTSQTLSREFWKGQLHGSGLGRTPIHATHMRPRCSVIPGETQSLFGEQRRHSTTSDSQGDIQEERKISRKDLAIFMPYLHWETSSRRARMTRIVQEVLSKRPKKSRLKRHSTRPAIQELKLDSFVDKLQPKKEETGKRRALANYLLKLAQVWQAMDMELDERLVKLGLLPRDPDAEDTEPLLHIRRTLDQSYFMNLKDTSQRDRDQVVYRATKWQGNLARVVMVDQLWLWILDEHTIITSFPKRWGRNKPDPSGIHKSLRDRLGRPDCKIMSAWHLACIIIDQCSNVFFDRTKPLDLRPEVMDIFTETLGDVNHYTAIAFKVFWQNVENFAKNQHRRGPDRPSQKYLDINPEGTLLREAQDIAEELRIMIGIYHQQLGVVKSFQRCLEHMNGDPKTRNKPQHMTKHFQHFFDWTRDQALSPQLRMKKPVSIAEMDFLEDLVDEVENRKLEIMDLENAAFQTCQQLQELLTLKQQQASIVAAKAALDRADQSVKQADESIQQGKAIMAFTIMTIIFTPLGFFTSFFGMNNSLTGAEWMTLGRQCLYMFSTSAAIIIIALSLALKTQMRNFLKSTKGPKARWHALKTWWQEKKPKPAERTTEKGDEGQINGMNGASAADKAGEGQSNGTSAAKYYQVSELLRRTSLGKRVRRINHSWDDLENSRGRA